MHAFFGLLCGLIFGLGLIVAQMTNPAKVIGFLDILDGWDPSLALVMGSGLMVFGVGYFLLKDRKESLLGLPVILPKMRDIDPPLIIGAALFGLGWGLIGLCPGPAVAALTIGGTPIYTFMAAMIAGMLFYKLYETRKA